mmetsp:Transcript_6453/g.11356  ORF Transcript_6453/g.11356 Transcript_6453/m.11356 type:complete len:364 (+) Transcript_6453:697-1788(+)
MVIVNHRHDGRSHFVQVVVSEAETNIQNGFCCHQGSQEVLVARVRVEQPAVPLLAEHDRARLVHAAVDLQEGLGLHEEPVVARVRSRAQDVPVGRPVALAAERGEHLLLAQVLVVARHRAHQAEDVVVGGDHGREGHVAHPLQPLQHHRPLLLPRVLLLRALEVLVLQAQAPLGHQQGEHVRGEVVLQLLRRLLVVGGGGAPARQVPNAPAQLLQLHPHQPACVLEVWFSFLLELFFRLLLILLFLPLDGFSLVVLFAFILADDALIAVAAYFLFAGLNHFIKVFFLAGCIGFNPLPPLAHSPLILGHGLQLTGLQHDQLLHPLHAQGWDLFVNLQLLLTAWLAWHHAVPFSKAVKMFSDSRF